MMAKCSSNFGTRAKLRLWLDAEEEDDGEDEEIISILGTLRGAGSLDMEDVRSEWADIKRGKGKKKKSSLLTFCLGERRGC